MDTIHLIVFLLGFTMVGMGLGFARNFLNNEEKKNEELLQRCYALAEDSAKQQIRDLVPVGVYTEEEIREKGV